MNDEDAVNGCATLAIAGMIGGLLALSLIVFAVRSFFYAIGGP